MKSLFNRFFSRKPRLLMEEDPKAFLAVVMNPSNRERAYSLHTFDDIMVCETLRCGFFNDPAVKQETRQTYNGLFLKAEPKRRAEIYNRLRPMVSALGGERAGAFVPFMLLDPDMEITATATVDYISMGSLIDGDPMSRPKDVLQMIEAGLPENVGAVIGGLLGVGDPRVCDLVAPLRPTIYPSESRVITMCYPGRTCKCVVEFYLDWADQIVESDEDKDQAVFGDVVAGLLRLAQLRQSPAVYDGLRPFPVPKDGLWPDLQLIDFDKFAHSISERVFDLERREAAPKLMPNAIRAFGLEPRTAVADTVQLPPDIPFHFAPKYH